MLPHTRAMVAASAFALITGKKVAGMFDHSSGRDLRIAAEARGDAVQGFDQARGVKFGGTLPEIYDAGDEAFVSLQIIGTKAEGHDRATASAFVVQVTDGVVQVFDHSQSAWFAYDMQDSEAAQSYHRRPDSAR